MKAMTLRPFSRVWRPALEPGRPDAGSSATPCCVSSDDELGDTLTAALSLFVPYAVAIRGLVFCGVTVVVFVLAVAAVALTKRSRSAMFYAASWAALLLGIFFFLLRTLGVLPDSFLSVWGPQSAPASRSPCSRSASQIAST
jgi:hypothetical protein